MKYFGSKPKQTGVTLVELVISIVVISIAMVALLNSFSVSINQSADPMWRNKTLKLAQLYLDEILAKSYDHSTPVGGVPAVTTPDCSGSYLGSDAGETRETYNDVDDYDDFSESPPTSVTDVDLSGYSDYSVDITVACRGNSVSAEDAAGAVSNAHAKYILVTITAPNGESMNLSAYKGNF